MKTSKVSNKNIISKDQNQIYNIEVSNKNIISKDKN